MGSSINFENNFESAGTKRKSFSKYKIPFCALFKYNVGVIMPVTHLYVYDRCAHCLMYKFVFVWLSKTYGN